MGLIAAGIFCAYWLARLVVCIARTRRVALAFWMAPILGGLTLGIVSVSGPTPFRWAASESAFEALVRDLQPLPPVDACLSQSSDCDPGWGPRLDVPSSVGRYTVHSAERVAGGIIFHTGERCNWLDGAGIGWFPDAPDAERLETGSFERPEFTHLGGPWYRWCASW